MQIQDLNWGFLGPVTSAAYEVRPPVRPFTLGEAITLFRSVSLERTNPFHRHGLLVQLYKLFLPLAGMETVSRLVDTPAFKPPAESWVTTSFLQSWARIVMAVSAAQTDVYQDSPTTPPPMETDTFDSLTAPWDTLAPVVAGPPQQYPAAFGVVSGWMENTRAHALVPGPLPEQEALWRYCLVAATQLTGAGARTSLIGTTVTPAEMEHIKLLEGLLLTAAWQGAREGAQTSG